MESEKPSSTLLYKAECQVVDELVQLSFSRECSGVYLLSRRVSRVGGASFTQLINVSSASILYDFATSDPFSIKLRSHYENIRLAFEERCDIPLESINITDPEIALRRISDCKSDAELLVLVQAIVHLLGATNFVFHCLRFESEKALLASDSRYLVGCRPSWMQQYITRVFYLQDQYLQYARSNLAAALTSAIGREGNRVSQEARRYGFVNGLIVPAHSPKNGFFGFLHVGNSLEPNEGEATLLKHEALYIALSIKLLSWRVDQLRDGAMFEFNLSFEDVSVIRAYGKRRSIEDVADKLETTTDMSYKHFQRIAKKLGVKRIHEALTKASEFFLVD